MTWLQEKSVEESSLKRCNGAPRAVGKRRQIKRLKGAMPRRLETIRGARGCEAGIPRRKTRGGGEALDES